MSKKVAPTSIAVIEIGSSEIRMKIAESGKNALKYIESLNFPLPLGNDTFEKGKIGFDKVEKACNIINNYLLVAKEYGVSDVRVIATSAVGGATNSDYLVDQIKIKTTLQATIADDTEEKLYIYKLMNHLLLERFKKASMLVYIGSGSVGVSVLEDGKMPYLETIKIGSFRIREIFSDLSDNSNKFYSVVEEYLKTYTAGIASHLPKTLNNFIASGYEVALIAKICDAKTDGFLTYISREKFLTVYNELKYKTAEKLMDEYNLTVEKSQVLLPAMAIFHNLLTLTDATEIIAPAVFFIDAVIFEALYPEQFLEITKDFSKNSIASAKKHAKHYKANEGHYSNVATYALKIFDKMKKIHGMGSRARLYLHVAAIMHDCGCFISIKKHYAHSYTIVKASEIVGLTTFERELVACICMYHARKTPQNSHEQYARLSAQNRVLVSKLTAILRIADALNIGGQIKFNSFETKILDNALVITVSSDVDTRLEEWEFKQKSMFFEEVFGMKAILKKKKEF